MKAIIIFGILALGVVLGFFLMMFIISGLFWICTNVGLWAGLLLLVLLYVAIIKFSRNG